MRPSPARWAVTPCSCSWACSVPTLIPRRICSSAGARSSFSPSHRTRPSLSHLAGVAAGLQRSSLFSFRNAAAALSVVPTAAGAAATATTAAADAMLHSSTGAGAGALWATCLVLFGGACLTGLPPVLWWGPSPAGGPTHSAGLAAILQGPSLRMLSAGLMLGSGLGVVVPEGFFTFAENAPPDEHGGLPEWSAGAAMLAGFVGMLALQLWLESRSRASAAAAAAPPPAPPEAVAAVATAAAAAAPGAAPSADGAAASGAAGHAHGDGDADGVSGGGGGGGGIYSLNSWRQRREGGYSALPSTAVADVEAADSAAAAAALAAAGGMELSRRHGGAAATAFTVTTATATAATAAAPSQGASSGGATRLHSGAADGGKAPPAAAGVCEQSAAAGVSGVAAAFAVDAVARVAAPVGPSSKSAPATSASGGGGGGAPALSSAQFALGGLLVHSAADGMAVGAASLGGGGGGGGGPSALTLAVVAAIMMHKLPVTLGLTTYLREAGWGRGRVLQALLAFSASAPLSALASFYLLGLLLPAVNAADTGSDGGGASQAVALAVLFSGGTFLAAATQHILPAALAATLASAGAEAGATAAAGGDSCGAHGPAAKGELLANGGGDGGAGGGAGSGRLLPLMWLAVGSAAPLLIAALLPEA